MGFELDIFGDKQLEADYIEWLVDEQSIDVRGLDHGQPAPDGSGPSAVLSRQFR